MASRPDRDWVPQPRAPGMSYITAEMKAAIDLSESRVGLTDDEATWDMAASLGLSRQLTTGAVLDELVKQGHDIVVCTADLGPADAGDRFRPQVSRPLFQLRHRRAQHDWRCGRPRHDRPHRGDQQLLVLPRADGHREHPQRHLLPRPERAHDRHPLGPGDGLLRHVAPLQRGHRCAARDRRPDADGAVRRQRDPRRVSSDRSRTTARSICAPAAAARSRCTTLRPTWRIGGSNTLREGRHATVLAIGNLVSAPASRPPTC